MPQGCFQYYLNWEWDSKNKTIFKIKGIDFSYLQEGWGRNSMAGARGEPLAHTTQADAYSASLTGPAWQGQPDRTGQRADCEIKEASTHGMKVDANIYSCGGK